MQESPQHICKSRTAKVVLAVDLFATVSEAMFQVPQIRRQLDLTGHSFCFLNHLVNLSLQGSVEGSASANLSDLDQVSRSGGDICPELRALRGSGAFGD